MRLYLYMCDECGVLTGVKAGTPPDAECNIARDVGASRPQIICEGTVRYIGNIDLMDPQIDDMLDLLPEEILPPNREIMPRAPTKEEAEAQENLPPWLR